MGQMLRDDHHLRLPSVSIQKETSSPRRQVGAAEPRRSVTQPRSSLKVLLFPGDGLLLIADFTLPRWNSSHLKQFVILIESCRSGIDANNYSNSS